MNSTLGAFQRQQYLNLETFKRSGESMKTPVWFVEDHGVLYVRTVKNSGKVKRVRNNPQVRVAPCSVNGELKGEWLDATAELLPATEDKRINQLLKRKYGLMKLAIDLGGRLQKQQPDTIAIRINRI
jgi:PPOX class probable F420-dependent enzyme